MYTIDQFPNEDALLWNACLTEVQQKALLDWSSTKGPEVHESIRKALADARVTV